MVAVFPARIVRGFAEARSTLAGRHQHAVVLVPISEYDALGRTPFRIEVMHSRPVRVTTNHLRMRCARMAAVAVSCSRSRTSR